MQPYTFITQFISNNDGWIAMVDYHKFDGGKVGCPGAVKYGDTEQEAHLAMFKLLESRGHTIVSESPSTPQGHEIANEEFSEYEMRRVTERLTNEQRLEVAQIIGGADRFSKEAQIAQVKEILCRMHNMQTNLTGLKWFKVFQYLKTVYNGMLTNVPQDFIDRQLDLIETLNSQLKDKEDASTKSD